MKVTIERIPWDSEQRKVSTRVFCHKSSEFLAQFINLTNYPKPPVPQQNEKLELRRSSCHIKGGTFQGSTLGVSPLSLGCLIHSTALLYANASHVYVSSPYLSPSSRTLDPVSCFHLDLGVWITGVLIIINPTQNNLTPKGQRFAFVENQIIRTEVELGYLLNEWKGQKI